MFINRTTRRLQLQCLKDPINQLSIILYHDHPMGLLVHPQATPARTQATSLRQHLKPAPKPAQSACRQLGTGRTGCGIDGGIDGGTYDDTGRYVDMMAGGGVVPLLLKFVVVVVDELLLLLRENDCGSVGSVVRSLLMLLPMSLLSLGEGGGGAVVLLLFTDRGRETPSPLLFVTGAELVVASRYTLS